MLCLSLTASWPIWHLADPWVSAEPSRYFPALVPSHCPQSSPSILTSPGAGSGYCWACTHTEEKHHHHHRQDDKVPVEQACPSLEPWGWEGPALSGSLSSPPSPCQCPPESPDQRGQNHRTQIQRMGPTVHVPPPKQTGGSLLVPYTDMSLSPLFLATGTPLSPAPAQYWGRCQSCLGKDPCTSISATCINQEGKETGWNSVTSCDRTGEYRT